MLMGGNNEVRVEIGTGAVRYIPSFIKIGSGIQKLIEGNTQTQTAW
jgi:hypothetical protein